MQESKRKIKAKPLVEDIRAGLSDEEIMVKYGVSLRQLEKLLWRLLDVGAISEMELYERTSVSESTVTRAFADTTQALECILRQGASQPSEIDPAAEVECTEVIDFNDKTLTAEIDKFGRAWGTSTDNGSPGV